MPSKQKIHLRFSIKLKNRSKAVWAFLIDKANTVMENRALEALTPIFHQPEIHRPTWGREQEFHKIQWGQWALPLRKVNLIVMETSYKDLSSIHQLWLDLEKVRENLNKRLISINHNKFKMANLTRIKTHNIIILLTMNNWKSPKSQAKKSVTTTEPEATRQVTFKCLNLPKATTTNLLHNRTTNNTRTTPTSNKKKKSNLEIALNTTPIIRINMPNNKTRWWTNLCNSPHNNNLPGLIIRMDL